MYHIIKECYLNNIGSLNTLFIEPNLKQQYISEIYLKCHFISLWLCRLYFVQYLMQLMADFVTLNICVFAISQLAVTCDSSTTFVVA